MKRVAGSSGADLGVSGAITSVDVRAGSGSVWAGLGCVRETLLALADEGYRDFNRRIVPTDYQMIGVRMPALRRLARQIAAGPAAEEFLWNGLGEQPLYEEVMLHGLVLAARSRKMPFDDLLTRFERLVPRFDNWAHVDTIVSEFKIFAQHREKIYLQLRGLCEDPGEFARRTWVVILMDFFMDNEHIEFTLNELQHVPQGQYYVDMAIAWALSVALVKHWRITEPVLKQKLFTPFVHNKAIQKARESFRISLPQKEYLNTLKIR